MSERKSIPLTMMQLGSQPAVVASNNPCEGCPGNKGCCGGEKAGLSSPLMESAIKITTQPAVLTFSSGLGTRLNPDVLTKSSSQTQAVANGESATYTRTGGGSVEQTLTCDSCGDKYYSGSSCEHKSMKKAA